MAGHRRRLVAAAIAATAASSAGLALQVHPAWADDSPSAASQFVAEINALRAAHGVAPLSVSSSLISIAAGWSAHLAAAGSLSHNPALAASAPAGWRLLGENVGVGPSVANLQQAFTNSPEHYANMVDPRFDTIGVSVDVSPQGYLWVTEDYMETPAAAKVVNRASPIITVSAPIPVRPLAAPPPPPAPVAAAPAVHPAPAPAPPAPAPAAAPTLPVPVPAPAPAPPVAAPAPVPASRAGAATTTTTPLPSRTPVTVGAIARTPHSLGTLVPVPAAHGLSARAGLLALGVGLVLAGGLTDLVRRGGQLVGPRLIRSLRRTRPAGAGRPSR